MEVHDEHGALVLTDVDTRVIDAVLSVQPGYILDFSTRTFDQFILQRYGVDAAASEFLRLGPSKANRLRSILASSTVPGTTKAEILEGFFDWRIHPERNGQFPELSDDTARQFNSIVQRLRGKPDKEITTNASQWTGRPTIQERIVIVRELAPLALSEIELLIRLVEDNMYFFPQARLLRPGPAQGRRGI